MILSNTPQNEAIVSNVAEIGEFRIRNSAKAFSILSSSLYSNKIRAILRELSCNALDSHVAAGNKEEFVVHLPTLLEPWFSVQDYGLGLSHDQVTNIYTTYFESTKTNSNDFIGGLGLGSKSPFAYTDNFTVSAVKDGIKGLYSAFINESGVPSIALMFSSNTNEPNGVEVKFSVNNKNDFYSFAQEASEVFKYFGSNTPKVIGGTYYKCDISYKEKDIIPSIHLLNGSRKSFAIMGNVPYPIDVPNPEQNLGHLATLLTCGLEIHFTIGELDFQASREGLSYIPQTIQAIKTKLELLNSHIQTNLAIEADKIDNLWKRQEYLLNKAQVSLWAPAVISYVQSTKFPLIEYKGSSLNQVDKKISVNELKNNYNIKLTPYYLTNSTYTKRTKASYFTQEKPKSTPENPHPIPESFVNIHVNHSTKFVINDTKVGALEKSKSHFRLRLNSYFSIYVIDKVDKTKPMDHEGFLSLINDPDQDQLLFASTFEKSPRQIVDKTKIFVSFLERSNSYYGNKWSWTSFNDLSDFNSKETYYYVPVVGYNISKSITNDEDLSVRVLAENLKYCGDSILSKIAIYGVKKSNLKTIEALPNWINLEKYISNYLTSSKEMVYNRNSKSIISLYSFSRYADCHKFIDDKASEIVKIYDLLKKTANINVSSQFDWLLQTYLNSQLTANERLNKELRNKCQIIEEKYPLISKLDNYTQPKLEHIAQYINLINQKAST